MDRSALVKSINRIRITWRYPNLLGSRYGNREMRSGIHSCGAPSDFDISCVGVAMLTFSVKASAFENMTYEETRKCFIEGYPEYEWGRIDFRREGELLHVVMEEAESYAQFIKEGKINDLVERVRESAEIIVYDDGSIDVPGDDKQFLLSLELDKNEVLELMDIDEFEALVIRQFPEYPWLEPYYIEMGDELIVVLQSWGMRNYIDFKGEYCIKTSSMKAIHLDLVGYQRLAMLVKKNAFVACSERDIITISLSLQLLELFSEAELSQFIAEQFPGYTVHVDIPKKKDAERFGVILLKNEQAELTD